jgi:vanillate O-demethylase ferredoxin subunit
MMKDDLIAARVVACERAACDVILLRLVSDEADVPLPAFEAGAHIDLHLRDGLTRKYSLCSDPFERGFYEIAVEREPASRGGSAYVHDAIRVGDVLPVGKPQNYFPLAPDDSPGVLLAAGIGITPLLAMAHSLKRAGRALVLHYFVRSLDGAAYGETLQGQLADVSTLHVGLTSASTSAMIEQIVGRMDSRAHLYFCGPSLFMDAVDAIARAHVPAARVHHEHFSAQTPSADGEDEFEIELARSKRVLTVPADKSITDVLYEQGVPIETSCEAGICGACCTAVLAGTPDHRDTFLSAAEKARSDSIMPCVSRCKTVRLVLDI